MISEGELTITLADSSDSNLLQADVTFYGRDPVDSVFSESLSGGEWSLTLTASPASSANSMIFFSSAQALVVSPVGAALACLKLVNGQCSETSSVDLVFIYLYSTIFMFPSAFLRIRKHMGSFVFIVVQLFLLLQ